MKEKKPIQDRLKVVASKSQESSALKIEKENQKLAKIAHEIIRPELNIEKHADFIFIPAHSKRVRQSRRREGWITLPDGSKEQSYLEITPIAGGKTPTTTTRKIYLALQKLYEEKQKEGKLLPDEGMVVSAREVVKAAMLFLSGNNIRLVHNEINILRSCLFRWVNFFIAPTGEKYRVLSTANILDTYEYIEQQHRYTPEEQYQAAHVIRFGKHIRNNLDMNKTKPVNYTTVMSIQGELALVLYTRLDIILADKEHYSRTSKGIFEDLNLLDEKEYLYPYKRKRKLEKAIEELNSKCISTGLLKLKLQKTTDGTDWKLIAQKITLIPTYKQIVRRITPANLPDAIALLGKDIGDIVGQYKEKHRLYETFAVYYPADFIYQALSEYKHDGKDIKHPAQYFTSIMHRIAHQRGREWIKPCPSDCKYRSSKNN